MTPGMKPRNIARHLESKFADWLGVLEAEGKEGKVLAALVRKDGIITGGAIASLLLGEEVNDYDVYFRSFETALAVAEYYVGRFKPSSEGTRPLKVRVEPGIVASYEDHCFGVPDSAQRIKIVAQSSGVASEVDGPAYQYFESRPDDEAAEYLDEVVTNPATIEEAYEAESEHAQKAKGKPRYRPVFVSTNAITLSHGIQIVVRFYGEPDAIHENYDFVHCTNYWLSRDGALTLRPAALESLLCRDLRYVGSRYPVCSLIRLRKFIKRGWRVTAGQVLKMVMQASELDLTNFKVLEDQLTGVDCAYFSQLLDRVKQANPDKVDGAYLVELIDRMF